MRRAIAFWLLVAVFSSAPAASSDDSGDKWSKYRPSDLGLMLDDHSELHAKRPGIYFVPGHKYRVQAKGFTLTRETPPEMHDFMSRWQAHFKTDHGFEAAFARVALVRRGTQSIWMPIQSPLVNAFEKALPGGPLELYIMWIGILPTGQSVFMINAFRELPLDPGAGSSQ